MGNVVNFVRTKLKYPQPSFPQLETTCEKNVYPAVKTNVESQEVNWTYQQPDHLRRIQCKFIVLSYVSNFFNDNYYERY